MSGRINIKHWPCWWLNHLPILPQQSRIYECNRICVEEKNTNYRLKKHYRMWLFYSPSLGIEFLFLKNCALPYPPLAFWFYPSNLLNELVKNAQHLHKHYMLIYKSPLTMRNFLLTLSVFPWFKNMWSLPQFSNSVS